MHTLTFVVGMVCCFLLGTTSTAATFDARMHVELHQKQVLNIQEAINLAAPILWLRVVPTAHLQAANLLATNASLVLRYKPLPQGARVVFNPTQVLLFLRKHDIPMITTVPHWDLSINVTGFPTLDVQFGDDLIDYSQDIASELGFQIDARGKRLEILFSPTVDAYGEAMLQVSVQGSFTAEVLPRTTVIAEGYTSYQLQAWLRHILIDIRDAYVAGDISRREQSSITLLTIEAAHSLSTQVMLEQALRNHPAVVSLAPMLLQQARRQYSLQLRGGDETWIPSWFADYGLVAKQQVDDSFTDWLVQ